jgi:hypothetical protein
LEDQDVGGWTILKWILEIYDGVVWTDLAQERAYTSSAVKQIYVYSCKQLIHSFISGSTALCWALASYSVS